MGSRLYGTPGLVNLSEDGWRGEGSIYKDSWRIPEEARVVGGKPAPYFEGWYNTNSWGSGGKYVIPDDGYSVGDVLVDGQGRKFTVTKVDFFKGSGWAFGHLELGLVPA